MFVSSIIWKGIQYYFSPTFFSGRFKYKVLRYNNKVRISNNIQVKASSSVRNNASVNSSCAHNCSIECLCVTQKSNAKEYLHNKCHKIYLSGPFRIFCLYVILTISYLRAQTIDTSSLSTDSSRPQFEQIEIFSSILTVYLNCKYCP